MALEVVSESSVHKDTVQLRELYWRAGIAEYWLVDARPASPRFDILRHGERFHGHTKASRRLGEIECLRSLLSVDADGRPLGDPLYVLNVRT